MDKCCRYEPIFRKFETGNTASNIMHIDEVVHIIVLNVKNKEITGKITVCLPFVWLESLMRSYTQNTE
jgi:flagellar motor switch protein FliM